MCLWAIYMFPGSVHIFPPAEKADPSWDVYNSLTDTWMWKFGLRPHIFLFWEYLFQIFRILSLQCSSGIFSLQPSKVVLLYSSNPLVIKSPTFLQDIVISSSGIIDLCSSFTFYYSPFCLSVLLTFEFLSPILFPLVLCMGNWWSGQ